MFDDSDCSPSVHALHSDAAVRSSAMPEEWQFPPKQDADAFPPDEPMTDEEIDRLCEAEEARRMAEAGELANEPPPAGTPVTVVARESVGCMGFLTVEDANGKRRCISDLASVFADNHVGDTGTLADDSTGALEFYPDPEPLPVPEQREHAGVAYRAYAERDSRGNVVWRADVDGSDELCCADDRETVIGVAEAVIDALTLTLLTRPVRLNPAAWGVTGGDDRPAA
jgi:hypothetical protein